LYLNIKGENELGEDYFKNNLINESIPIVIWWTPFTMDIGSYKQCGDALNRKTCFFTNSRKYRNLTKNKKAFMFYGTDFYLHDLPMPRNYDIEDWALLHEESPKNNYLFSFDPIMKLFNHTATFKRQSDCILFFIS
jgi:alpha-1,3-fucosyltransferase 10